MCKVFAIYPTDKKDSTKFLNKINTFLCKNLGADWHCYKIKFSDEDHQRCLNSAQSSAAKFIIFMGHGRGDKLLGSFNKKAEDFISNDALSLDLYLIDLFIISHLHKSVVIHFLHCPLYDLRYQKTVDQHDRHQRDQIVKDKRFFIRLFYFLHIGFLPHSCKMV